MFVSMFITKERLFTLVSFFFVIQLDTVYTQQFNYEVEKRVLDRLGYYLGKPIETNQFLNDLLENGGFVNNLHAPDRDLYLTIAHSLPQKLVYYGLENGLFVGQYETTGMYREPGYSGYDILNKKMKKYLTACVADDTGEPQLCLLQPGDMYVKLMDNDNATSLEPCPFPQEANCLLQYPNSLEKENACSMKNTTQQQPEKKWCRRYAIETVTNDTTLGFVPLTSYCIDRHGRFSQELGNIVPRDGSFDEQRLGNCYFSDGTTLVNRKVKGSYAYCGNNDKTCTNAFSGGFESASYDPRYRPWYMETKLLQRPNWSPPYHFYGSVLGITYSHPIYTTEEGKKIFTGVLAVDYTFDNIANFLVESYANTSTSVVIYEDAEPNYVIGASTGSDSVKKFLARNFSQPCHENDGLTFCTFFRVHMADLSGDDEIDPVLVRAFQLHKDGDYPRDLLSVRVSDDVNSGIYVSQSTLYEESGANLKWRVIVLQPGQQSTTDAITRTSPGFSLVCSVGALGITICIGFFMMFYSKRKETAIIHADWRFTCVFLFGCAIFNLSTFTLLGPNNDATCLLRMWSFHFLFVVALTPLFVKVWRIKQLVGSQSIRRVQITNTQAAIHCMPLILTQFIILILLTLLDPPKQVEKIEKHEGIIQHIVCESSTKAQFIVEFIFEAGLILIGCILAYMTRNMDNRFGESKQLIFAMYNIALVGVVLLILMTSTEVSANGRSLLQAIGVFWGTIFSSAAFVLPRFLQVQEDAKERAQGTKDRVLVSGFQQPTSLCVQSVDNVEDASDNNRSAMDCGS